jgi:hypothetical protein
MVSHLTTASTSESEGISHVFLKLNGIRREYFTPRLKLFLLFLIVKSGVQKQNIGGLLGVKTAL